jgi:hypothetical protein
MRLPNSTYTIFWSSREGQEMLTDIRLVARTKMLQKDKNGRVDSHAAMYAAGQRDLLDDIDKRIEDGKLSR